MWKRISCTIAICSFYENICPGILFKIVVCVTLLFGINLFQQTNFSTEVPSSKRSAGRLVKVLFYFLKHVEENFMRYWNTLFLFTFFTQNVVFKFFRCQSRVGLYVVCIRYLDRFGRFSAFRSGPQSARPTVVAVCQ